MKTIHFLLMVFAILPGCKSDSLNSETHQNVLTFTVEFDDRKQAVHGFGASDAWSIQFVGRNWPLEKRQQIADLLFNTDLDTAGNPTGIGLSIWRFNIGAGSARQGENSGIGDSWRRAESFLTADSTYDWNRQQGQQWFMKAARERGVDQFIGFVNSPPILLTKTGKAFGDGSGQANIAPVNYNDFGDYLARIAQYMEKEGTPFEFISPVNEPQWDWSDNNGQEGSPYQNGQIVEVVKALDRKIQEYNLNSRIEIPETAQINFLFSDGLPGRSNQIDYFFGTGSGISQLPSLAQKIAAHSYFTTWPVRDMIEQRRRVNESIQNTNSSLEYWMNEYCILADNTEIKGNGRDLGIDPALYVARVLHFDLTVANASAWQWWLAVSPYDYKDGLVYIDKDTLDGEIYESKLLWGLGNYSHFIRPGAVRLGIQRSDKATPEQTAGQVMTSVYLHEEEDKFTSVFVNYSRMDRAVIVDLNSDKSFSDFKIYLTSSDADLEFQGSISVGDTLVIPARSIMTLQADLYH